MPGQPGLDQAPAAADLAERRLPLRQPLPRSQDKGVRMAARCWCRTSESRDRDGASESRGRRWWWWCLSRDLRANASCANSKAAPPTSPAVVYFQPEICRLRVCHNIARQLVGSVNSTSHWSVQIRARFRVRVGFWCIDQIR